MRVGVISNLNFGEVEVRNTIRSLRKRDFDVNNAQSTLNYFKRRQMENLNFFYSLKLDEDNRIDTIFWIGACSRANYYSFEDVITFDTTYSTNKYSVPFTPFSGVNHHYQSILLGFVLLRDET